MNTPAPSSRYVWYVIGLLCVVNVFSYMDRMALAVLAPSIKLELSLTDAQLGLLTGLAFSFFHAVCGLPIARWADRGVRRDIIALALTFWSVMTVLCGSAREFWHLFAARMGIGAGESGSMPASQSIICDYVPLKRRPGMFALHTFGNYAGMVIGMALAGWLGQTIGWRLTFVLLGVPGIALAVVVKLTLREPVRGSLDATHGADAPLSLIRTIAWLWSCKTYRQLMLMYVLYGFVLYSMTQWWPSFYVRVFGLKLSSVGLYLGIAIGGGSALGLLLGGLLSNKVAQRDITLPLKIGAVAILIALPAAFGSLFVSSVSISLLLVALTLVLLSVCNGPLVANINSVVPATMRATASAITVFCTSVLGFGLGPFCIGALSDALTPMFGNQALRYAMIAPQCLIPVMALVLYGAAKTLPVDLSAENRI